MIARDGGGRRGSVHGGRRAGVAGAGRGRAGRRRARRRWYRGRLVVLRGEGALVQHVLSVVSLRCRLDVHESNCGTNATNRAPRHTRARARARARGFRSTQQLDILDSAIAVKIGTC